MRNALMMITGLSKRLQYVVVFIGRGFHYENTVGCTLVFCPVTK